MTSRPLYIINLIYITSQAQFLFFPSKTKRRKNQLMNNNYNNISMLQKMLNQISFCLTYVDTIIICFYIFLENKKVDYLIRNIHQYQT